MGSQVAVSSFRNHKRYERSANDGTNELGRDVHDAFSQADLAGNPSPKRHRRIDMPPGNLGGGRDQEKDGKPVRHGDRQQTGRGQPFLKQPPGDDNRAGSQEYEKEREESIPSVPDIA